LQDNERQNKYDPFRVGYSLDEIFFKCFIPSGCVEIDVRLKVCVAYVRMNIRSDSDATGVA
jgi:hypothetical protein